MKQIIITKAGSPDVLQLQEKPDPQPKAGELLIRVRAAGINFADILARKGMYPDAPKLPCVVGYEVSGIVESVGEGVDSSWIDKPVIALTRFSGYSDVVVVPEHQVFEKSDKLSFDEAAAIPVNYVTAWQLLVAMGGLEAKETVLVHNAGGGVGLAALDIIKHFGARAIGTASAGKHDFLKQRGYDHLIDYRNQDWSKALQEITDGKGVELIIDPLGGSNWKKSYAALRHTGRLGVFGVSTLTEGGNKLIGTIKFMLSLPKFNPLSLMNRNRGVFGVNVGHLWHESEKVNQWFGHILNGVEEGWIKPHIDHTFKFEEAGKAHQYIEDRKNIGKVILAP
jgi:synaptic vesicle membrane protein VAT-1